MKCGKRTIKNNDWSRSLSSALCMVINSYKERKQDNEDKIQGIIDKNKDVISELAEKFDIIE